MKKNNSLADALRDLRERGYTNDFTVETFCLYCGDLDMRWDPEQFKVDEEYRFEGDAAHDDGDTVVVAITSTTGIKGLLVDSYGSYAGNADLGLTKRQQQFAASGFT